MEKGVLEGVNEQKTETAGVLGHMLLKRLFQDQVGG